MKVPSQPHTSAGRFCVSCAATLVCWALWLVLGGTLAWQGYVALAKDLSVPDFILRRIESTLAAENFTVRFGRAHLDPRGGILLENVQLFSRSFGEPLLSSEYIYLQKSLWSIVAGHQMPDVVRLEGAAIQLPAMLSPSGTAEQLLRDVNADIRFSNKLWTVARLTGRIGNLPISVTGSLPPPRRSGGSPLTAAELTGRYLQFAKQIVLVLPELQSVERPILSVACTPREEGGMNLILSFSADALRRNDGNSYELGALVVSGRWLWTGLKPYPLELQLAIQSANTPKVSARNIRASVTVELGKGEKTPGPVSGQIAVAELQALGETFAVPVLTGSYQPEKGLLDVYTIFQSYGQTLAFDTVANLAQKSADVHFSGTVPPPLVSGMLTRYGPKLEPYFRFVDPVQVLAAHLKVDADWKFGGIWSRVQVGKMDSHGVQITSASGRVDVDGDRNFNAFEAHVLAGGNEARGTYWMNFRSMDYRFLLAGRLRPVDISGWFRSNWWPDFWSNFAFPAAAPQGDADVLGNWLDARRTVYFGSAETGPAEVLHADFERARAKIFVRPQFTHAFDLSVERAGGAQRASGWFKRAAKPGPRAATDLTFDLTGNLEAASLAKLGGAATVNLLAPFVFNQPPQLHLWGSARKTDDQTVNNIQFTGDVAGPLKYYHFPLDQVAVSGNLRGDLLQLEKIDLRTAGGHGEGRADLAGTGQSRKLSIDFKVKEADLARAIRAVEEFEAARTGVTSESMTESKFIKRASGGKLDLTLAAQGNPDNPARLSGTGALQLTGAELAEINLFGLLSQILSFSSLKLDAARSSFQMAEGRVFFPDVRITGKSAVIDAKGSYFIDNKTVDFTAHLKPYEETRNPLTAVVGLFMNPLTSMFELQLTGPLANPKWSFMLGSSTPKPFEPEKKPETPVPAESSPRPVGS